MGDGERERERERERRERRVDWMSGRYMGRGKRGDTWVT